MVYLQYSDMEGKVKAYESLKNQVLVSGGGPSATHQQSATKRKS
jgi:hypothetical protein